LFGWDRWVGVTGEIVALQRMYSVSALRRSVPAICNPGGVSRTTNWAEKVSGPIAGAFAALKRLTTSVCWLHPSGRAD
jgi:hypothetical protein